MTDNTTAVEDAGGDPSGWPTPAWSTASAQAIMKKAGISTAILSLTAPGVQIVAVADQAKLAREVNEYAAKLRDDAPEKFGFFAALPTLLNTKAAVEEIAYALDVLNADGVTLFTRYGDANYYLGHALFRPIWEELNKRKAVIFIHPTSPVDKNLISPALPQPVLAYPQESTNAAFDLIVSGTKRTFPDCKMILSHGGGTLPFLLPRAASLLPKLPPKFGVTMTKEEIIEDAKSFYFDLAMASSAEILGTLLEHFPNDHLLFGSDTPYAPEQTVFEFNEYLNEYTLTPELRRMLAFENAGKLFPRLKR